MVGQALQETELSRSGAGRSVPSADILWAWLREGWRYRKGQGWPGLRKLGSEPYVAQTKLEMGLVIGQDYVDYFLLVSDLVRFAKDRGIPVGPGRGSSAASIVCYLLRITEVDPLMYPLMDFGRFIVPGREDLPDIDIDFDDERRHEVREYAVRKYGADRVGNVGTFTKYKGRNSIDDVARVYRIPKADTEILKGMIVERSGGDSRADAALEDTFAMFPAAQEILNRHPALAQAVKLEGNYRGFSVHSAGLVITNSPIADTCALYTREEKKTGEQTTVVSVNKYDAEYLGLMKVDVLGLSTMGMIRLALEEAGVTLEELYRVPMDDAATLAAFKIADVIGIFQFEGRATRIVCRDVRPDDFLELVDISGLSRPGPLFSGTATDYIETKHGKQELLRLHPVIDEITEGTKGQIIYQEQILKALARYGGLEPKRVHDIRRIISQKLGEAQFNASEEAFVEGAARLHGVTRAQAMEVWGKVVTSASYAFVYAHSLAYTMIGFWCMWLKVHHPAAFYAAQLQKISKERWPRLIRDAESHGVRVSGVTFGRSGRTWTAGGRDTVLAGYEQLNGVGPALATKMLAWAEGHTFVGDPDQLLEIPGIGPAKLEALRPQLGRDPFGLKKIHESLEAVRIAIRTGEIPLATPTHDSETLLEAERESTVRWMGFVKLKEYKDFIEDERARSGMSYEEIRRTVRRPDLPTSCVLHCYDDGDEDVYVRVTRWDYPKYAKILQSLRLGQDVVYVEAMRSVRGVFPNLLMRKMVIIDPED
jgi:DNA polymerase-3 subunit alpha